MEENKYHRSLRGAFHWETYYIIPALSIVASVVLKIFDKGPLMPPFSEDFRSIDCHSIKYSSMNDRGGRIDFSFDVSPSVEYPPEYLPNFIQVHLTTTGSKFKISGDDIFNVSRDSQSIQFTVHNTFAGPTNVKTSCLDIHGEEFDTTLKNIEFSEPQDSYSDDPHADIAKYARVCLEYEKFLFFTSLMGDMTSVPFDDDKFRFEFLKMPLDAYLKHKSVNMTPGTTYMVSEPHSIPWKQIALDLIPLERSIIENQKTKELHLITRKDPSALASQIYRGFSNLKKLEPIQCFDTLMMTSTYSKDNKLTSSIISNSVKSDINGLRNRYYRNQTNQNRVVIAQSMEGLIGQVKIALPGWEVQTISEYAPLSEAIPIVSSAKIFISDHISTLIHLIWMNKEGTHIIDATPSKYSCNNWAQKMAESIGIDFKQLHPTAECECASFDCVPESPTVSTSNETMIETALKSL